MSPRYQHGQRRGYNPWLDGSGAPPEPFTPPDLPNVAYWGRADLDAAVGAWTCQVTGIDFAQATPSKQPALIASVAALNNKPSYRFAGSSQQVMQANNALSAWRFLHEGPFCVSIPFVATLNGMNAKGLWGTSDFAASGSVGSTVGMYTGATDWQIAFDVKSTARVVDSQKSFTGGTWLNTYRVSTFMYDPGATPKFQQYVDRTLIDSGSPAAAPAVASDPNGALTLGSMVAPANVPINWITGDMPEFVVFDGTPSAASLTALWDYYDARYL